MVNLILVDNNGLFRSGMKHMLKQYSEINLLANVAQGKQLLEALNKKLEAIVLLSTNIQDMSLIYLIKKIKRDSSKIKLVILANELNIILAKKFLAAGADSYILKALTEPQFIEIIKELKKDNVILPEELAQSLAKKGMSDGSVSPFESLSERETDILLLLLKGNSIKTISEILHLSPKTISTYKGRIFDKLCATSLIHVFFLATEYGLIDSQQIA